MGQPALDNWRYWADEMVKIAASFEYFLDEHVWIEDKNSQEPIKLELWDSQREKLPEYLSERLIIILKAHQLGYTWIFVAAYCLWEAMTKPMHHIVVNSFNEDVGVEILNRVDFILDRLPSEIYPAIGKSNTQLKEFIHREPDTGIPQPSIIQVIPATEKGAQSKTPTILIIDESAQNRYVRKTFVASKPGIDSAQGKVVIISNSIKDAPGWGFTREKYTESMKGLNTFGRIFLPWWANPLRPKNFKEIQLQEGMSEEDFKQRYPESEEEAISAMTGGYFAGTLAKHDKFIRDNKINGFVGHLERDKQKDLAFIQEQHDVMEFWRWPYHLTKAWNKIYWTKRYAIGTDVSEGLGKSYSAAYVLDRKLDELVCRVRSNRLDAVEWAKVLYWLSMWYSNAIDERGGFVPALICVERTGAGQTTVKELTKFKSPGARQYVRIIEGKVGSGLTRILGWEESESSKHLLCGDLKNWFRVTKGGFYCPILIDEASTTIKHEGTRRIGPEDDTKLWDTVVAAGCTIQASQFLEGPPKQIIPSVKGWRKRLAEEGRSNWGR